MRRHAALALSALLACATPALADGIDDTLAQRLKAEGDQALVDGRYAEALDAYRRAAAIEPDPALDYNLGRTLQALGRSAEALTALERFERSAPPELLARVPHLTELMAELRAQVAELTLTVNVPEATVYLDDRTIAPDVHGPLHVDAGTRRLRIEARGYVAHHEVMQLAPGAARSLHVRLVRDDASGMLSISANVMARISVDGRFVGSTPSDLRLAPGSHRVALESPGYERLDSAVVVREKEHRALRLTLQPKPPFYRNPWFWAVAGAVTAGTVVSVVALTTERDADSGTIPPGRVVAPLISGW
jgi:hypothetical protein